MSCIKTFQFSAAVRGFHYYRSFWSPQPEQILKCFHEIGNAFDIFAIKVCETSKDETVGHLPMEISRITKFLIDRGADVTAKLSSTNYRRSPLVQGGIEIPCIITVKMPGTILNQLLMERFKQLVQERYIEPKNEEILGSFLHIDDEGVKERPVPVPKKKKKKATVTQNDHQDIRNFFTTGANRKANKDKKEEEQRSVINID